jgi:hypothetical protein
MVLSITVGRVAALRICSGTPQDLTDEAMSEVDLSADPSSYRPRYTVYEITDPTKRNLDDGTVPVFQYSVGGTGAYTTLTTQKVEYPDCRIYLATALGSADTVRCHSGKNIVATSVAGVKDISFDGGWDSEKVMFLRDTAKTTVPKQKEWSATANTVMVKACATLTTDLAGANNDMVFTHSIGGTSGNDITITIEAPGAGALAVTVSGTDITISPNTTSTAKEVIEAFNRAGMVQDLNVRAELKSGETGEGTLAAMAHTHLAGGLEPTDWTDITGSAGAITAIAEFYADYDNDIRWVDFCQVIRSSISIAGDGINGVTLTFESRGGPNCGPFLRKQ